MCNALWRTATCTCNVHRGLLPGKVAQYLEVGPLPISGSPSRTTIPDRPCHKSTTDSLDLQAHLHDEEITC
jgi:hypothetical protein